jgi:hypothetical protein
MYVYVHVYVNICVCECVCNACIKHSKTCACEYTYMHVTHICMCESMFERVCLSCPPCEYVCNNEHMHMHIHVQTHSISHEDHIHTYMHTCIHTCIHTSTCEDQTTTFPLSVKAYACTCNDTRGYLWVRCRSGRLVYSEIPGCHILELLG